MNKHIINIELTDQEAKFLVKFAEKQYEGAEDNLGTMTPIHVVEKKRQDFHEGVGSEWMCEDTGYKMYYTFSEMLEDLRKSGKEVPEYKDVYLTDVNGLWIGDDEAYCEAYDINACRGTIVDTYHPVAFFLIRDEAVRYKDDYQKHNCGGCRIFTYGLGYSNKGDLPVFRELLMKMGTQLTQEKREKMKREFKFIGCDSWDRPVYEGEDGTLLVDVDPISTKPINLCTKYRNAFDGEPDMPIEYTKYKNDEVVVDRRVTWR